MLVSGVILGLYLWVVTSGIFATMLPVHDHAAIAAGVTLAVAAATYLWSPRQQLLQTALVSYVLLLAMVATLIVTSGQLSSPFIALWMIAAVFSPVFGWYGIGLIAIVAVISISYIWNAYGVDVSAVLTTLFASAMPVAVGILGLRPGVQATTSEDRTYHELASELNAESSKAEIVISAIADGVVAVDKAGAIQLINPAAQRLVGWGHKDAIGLKVTSVLKLVDDRDQAINDLNNPILQALRTNTPAHSEAYSLLTADTGKKLLASISASPLGSMGSGAIIVFRDITGERTEEREQAEFISTASHEMRTPVASIEGYLGLALNPATAQIDDKARDFITKAHESAQHLGRLFQDLLDVSKADDGRLNNDPRVIDVVPFFHDIIAGLLPKAAEKQLTIHYKPMPDFYLTDADDRGDHTLAQILYVHVDRDHLREVLANLTENAIKYTPAGTIVIDVTGTNHHVTMSITDTGIGIPKEDIGHLFQKFYRVDNSETREIGGTGLGLYLCRRLTEAMGGKIWVESTYQQGSTFFVRLPRLEHTEAIQLIEQAANQTEPQPIHTVRTYHVSPPPVAQPTPAVATTPPSAPPLATMQPDGTMRPPLASLTPQAPITRPLAPGALAVDIERRPAPQSRPAVHAPPPRTLPRYNR